MSKPLTRSEYNSLYGYLPDSRDELIELIKRKYQVCEEDIQDEIHRISNIEWKENKYTIFIVPVGSPRPRSSSISSTFYVSGVKETKELFSSIITDNLMICTRVAMHMDAYFPTPTVNMTPEEILLAEMGYIREISPPDFDNVMKSYTDPLQSLIILNDSLINPASIDKYYSLKPRVELSIKYQTEFDSVYNKNKITSSGSYKKLFLK